MSIDAAGWWGIWNGCCIDKSTGGDAPRGLNNNYHPKSSVVGSADVVGQRQSDYNYVVIKARALHSSSFFLATSAAASGDDDDDADPA